jgi:O-antigen/teichoic acid export membrane protein
MLEGCGCVMEVARMRLYQSIIGSVAAWAVLAAGGGLLAMPVMSTALALVAFGWLWRKNLGFARRLLALGSDGAAIAWREEIWPFQWKIAVSWLSGFFIFQLFTPILFAYRGAVEAGQTGMSIAIANALMGIAVAWINAKGPGFGALVANRDYKTLDRVFGQTMSRSLFVMAVLGVGLCVVNYVIHARHAPSADRILDPLPFTLLILATMFAYVTYAQATYLRAHKDDPFMAISVASALMIACFALVFGKEYGATGLMGVYASVYGIVGVGYGSVLFTTTKRRWQNVTLTQP